MSYIHGRIVNGNGRDLSPAERFDKANDCTEMNLILSLFISGNIADKVQKKFSLGPTYNE